MILGPSRGVLVLRRGGTCPFFYEVGFHHTFDERVGHLAPTHGEHRRSDTGGKRGSYWGVYLQEVPLDVAEALGIVAGSSVSLLTK